MASSVRKLKKRRKKGKRKKKMKIPRKQSSTQSEEIRRTATALCQRHARGMGEKVAGVVGLFDSINFRSFG